MAAVFAGLTVHVLTVKLARRLPPTWARWALEIAFAVIAALVISGLAGAVLGLWSFLPATVAEALPDTVADLRDPLVQMLRERGQKISTFGIAGIKTSAHLILGMVVGGMTALHQFAGAELRTPFAAALHTRVKALTNAFDKVVFARIKISALNTLLTAIYLLVVLPLFGISLPLLTVIIPLTFITGLLPVVGNLVSNTVIVLISLGVSPGVAVASLIFLITIHKLEYFTNARIIGAEVQAAA